jgi:hypothetical protein
MGLLSNSCSEPIFVDTSLNLMVSETIDVFEKNKHKLPVMIHRWTHRRTDGGLSFYGHVATSKSLLYATAAAPIRSSDSSAYR